MTPDYRYPPASQLFSSPSDSFYPDTLAPGGRRDQQDTPESCSFPATVMSPQSAASGARAAVYPFMLSKIQPSKRYLAVSAQSVYGGPYANIPVLARISVIDYRGNVLLDTLVRPTLPVTNFRYSETGLQTNHFASAPTIDEVKRQVATLISGKILVGHSLWEFLSALQISHPANNTRDLALFDHLRRLLQCRHILSLPILVNRILGRDIGLITEDPTENARAAMDLYRFSEVNWESTLERGGWPCVLPPAAAAGCFT
ncbi:uncharacterized protein STEHIDRAFT_151995 [Stereum hirsutum FP-91666 SS1]|uniref:uncharacterized protein n=1 Tax=Stereum hirsutum (strain FP-91666) TaxID=721885 RepID=UPI000440F5B8|nr:uncharacterized protein STEHIDRAFT_151995 [Stereum hirsutum FP-91666 SS1]EIM92686.1 hypothetical protein STEHIDRAFT_151995 [Stereum hirsutum FP-91666 SS1]